MLHEKKATPKAKTNANGLPAELMTLVASTLTGTRESLMIGESEASQVGNCRRDAGGYYYPASHYNLFSPKKQDEQNASSAYKKCFSRNVGQYDGQNRPCTDTIGEVHFHLDNIIKAKNKALERREEVIEPMRKSNPFCANHAEKNKTSHHEQTKSLDKSGPDRTGKLAERSESCAEGKQKLQKQDERQVSPALHDVKTVQHLANGKQSDRRIIVDSEASFHGLSSTNLTAIE